MANPPIIARIVFTLLLSFAFLAPVAFAQSSMTVRWSEERVSVQASGAAVASVLREVARQTDVQILGLDKATGTADVEFAGKHLIDGLRALLEDFNYVIVLNHVESAPTIWIHSRLAPDNSVADQSPRPGPAPNAADSTDTSGQLATSDERDQDQEEQVEAADRLKDASLESQQRVVLTGSTASRIAAMNAMAARHPKAAVAAVAAAIDDPEPAVSGAALQVLSHIDPIPWYSRPGAHEGARAVIERKVRR